MTYETSPIIDREKDFGLLWSAGEKIIAENPESAYTVRSKTYFDVSFPHKAGSHYPVRFMHYSGNPPEGTPNYVVEDDAPAQNYIHLTQKDGETLITSNLINEYEPTHSKSQDMPNVIDVYPSGDAVSSDGINRLYAWLYTMHGEIKGKQTEALDDLVSDAGLQFPNLAYDDKIARITNLIADLAVGESKRGIRWDRDGITHELSLIENSSDSRKEIQLVRSGGVVRQEEVPYDNKEIWRFTPSDDTDYMQILSQSTQDLFKQKGKLRKRLLRAFKSSDSQISIDRDVLGEELYKQRVMQGRNILLQQRA